MRSLKTLNSHKLKLERLQSNESTAMALYNNSCAVRAGDQIGVLGFCLNHLQISTAIRISLGGPVQSQKSKCSAHSTDYLACPGQVRVAGKGKYKQWTAGAMLRSALLGRIMVWFAACYFRQMPDSSRERKREREREI